jgi:hypothetical protein
MTTPSADNPDGPKPLHTLESFAEHVRATDRRRPRHDVQHLPASGRPLSIRRAQQRRWLPDMVRPSRADLRDHARSAPMLSTSSTTARSTLHVTQSWSLQSSTYLAERWRD